MLENVEQKLEDFFITIIFFCWCHGKVTKSTPAHNEIPKQCRNYVLALAVNHCLEMSPIICTLEVLNVWTPGSNWIH